MYHKSYAITLIIGKIFSKARFDGNYLQNTPYIMKYCHKNA